MNRTELYIGLMSGTSLDGVDAALVKFSTPNPQSNPILPPPSILPRSKQPIAQLKHFLTYPMPASLQETLAHLNTHPTLTLPQLAQLQLDIGRLFSGAAQALMMQAGIKTDQVQAIGSHGQTVYHAPHLQETLGMSLQLGHPAIIAKRTGLTTVADFRVDDMALGGEGAPLAPAFHRMLFQKVWQQGAIAIINIGGISNLTLLTAKKTFGFDIGPGNGLMDAVCQSRLQQPYDKEGQLARQGNIDTTLLKQLKQHPFFKKPAPKSTGKETFNLAWLQSFSLPECVEDLLATLTQLTVELIIESLKQLPNAPKEVLICGGGALNTYLMEQLQTQSPFPVKSTQHYEIDPQAIEAMLCAWLAQQRLHQLPIDLTTITGSSRPIQLGGIYSPT